MNSQRIGDYAPGPGLLKDRVILVTGAADGIGRAVAAACASYGATVLALDIKRRKLETLYDEITAAGCSEPLLVVHDLNRAEPAEHDAIAAGINQDLGKLDGIAHIAGTLPGLSAMHSHNLDAWDTIMQVNLRAPYLLTRACLPLLRQSADASVVFTSAACGRQGEAYYGAYAVAYGGVERMSETWADELEANTSIRFNTFDPGPVDTRMRTRTHPGETKDALPKPPDVAPGYLYLLGQDSIGVSGKAFSR